MAAALDVRAAVAGLPQHQRRCVVLRRYLGYPVDVTADALGISRQAVASLTYRGMQALRAAIDHEPATLEAPDAR